MGSSGEHIQETGRNHTSAVFLKADEVASEGIRPAGNVNQTPGSVLADLPQEGFGETGAGRVDQNTGFRSGAAFCGASEAFSSISGRERASRGDIVKPCIVRSKFDRLTVQFNAVALKRTDTGSGGNGKDARAAEEFEEIFCLRIADSLHRAGDEFGGDGDIDLKERGGSDPECAERAKLLGQERSFRPFGCAGVENPILKRPAENAFACIRGIRARNPGEIFADTCTSEETVIHGDRGFVVETEVAERAVLTVERELIAVSCTAGSGERGKERIFFNVCSACQESGELDVFPPEFDIISHVERRASGTGAEKRTLRNNAVRRSGKDFQKIAAAERFRIA